MASTLIALGGIPLPLLPAKTVNKHQLHEPVLGHTKEKFEKKKKYPVHMCWSKYVTIFQLVNQSWKTMNQLTERCIQNIIKFPTVLQIKRKF